MDEMIDRMVRIGIPAHRAYSICREFGREMDTESLEDYVSALEEDLLCG